jgi:hypothetical protein
MDMDMDMDTADIATADMRMAVKQSARHCSKDLKRDLRNCLGNL